jgi:hypothetical protein
MTGRLISDSARTDLEEQIRYKKLLLGLLDSAKFSKRTAVGVDRGM